MKQRSLRARLLIFIIIMMLAPLLPVLYIYNEYEYKLDDADNARQQSALTLSLTQGVIHDFHKQSIAWANFLLRGHKPELYNTHLRQLYSLERQTYLQTQSLSDSLNQDPEYSADISPILTKMENLRRNYRKALDIYNLSDDPYFDTDHFIAPFTAEILHDLKQLVNQIEALEKEKLSALHDEINHQKDLFLLIILASVFVTITAFLGFFDIYVGRPISTAISTAKRIADGDIHSRIKEESTREFAVFSEAFNHMIDNLERTNQQLETKISELEVAQKQVLEASKTIIELTNQEVESANRAKSEFISHMSHELHTPLNAILGFAQILKMGKLTPNQKDSTNEISTASEHLRNMINEVLDLSRIDSGTLDVSIETFDIETLVKETLLLVKHRAEKRGIQIDLDKQSFDKFKAEGDQIRCKEIILNLLSNAINYTHANGKVWVYCRRKLNMLVIAVCDDGPGIPKERQHEMFQAFNRLGAKNGHIEGTGVGLVISKHLANAMGGDLEFESEPNIKTCFSFSLPLAIAHKHSIFPSQ